MMVTAPTMTIALLAAAVLLGWARLWHWQRRAGAAGSAPWRIAALALLQPLAATALLFTLFPPAMPLEEDVLVVATAGTPLLAATRAPAGRLIALPEAPRIAGALALPDLATALRRFPATRRLVVLGEGLTPRDRDSARGLAISFTPPPPAPGLIALAPPGPVAPGAAFAVHGKAHGPAGSRVELVDPAGRVTDRATLAADGGFTLGGTARTAGPVLFGLRLLQADGTPIEAADVPVQVAAPPQPRLLILAGAPGPEVKYLRRWASDAGFAVQTQIAAGGGVALGDPPIALTPASLGRFDLAIVDARAWAGLGGGRSVLLGAVRDGLGLVLRSDDEAATRALWRASGLGLRGTGSEPVTLASAPPAGSEAATVARTRLGIGSRDRPAELDRDDLYLPEISRLAGAWEGPDVVPILPDAAGRALAAWRPLGLGRIAAFRVEDSYALTLTGRDDQFAAWWGGLAAAVARPGGPGEAADGPVWAGTRAPFCAVGPEARIEQPDGTAMPLLGDRGAAGCAAVWPGQAGWHRLVAGGETRLFYVHPADALAGIRRQQSRDATLQAGMAGPAASGSGPRASRPGPAWPWFVLWLAVCGVLWMLERLPRGRARA